MDFADFVLSIGIFALVIVALWLVAELGIEARRQFLFWRTRRYVKRQHAAVDAHYKR
jgi:hypothetical protein